MVQDFTYQMVQYVMYRMHHFEANFLIRNGSVIVLNCNYNSMPYMYTYVQLPANQLCSRTTTMGHLHVV